MEKAKEKTNELKVNDKVTIRKDYAYPKLTGKEGVIIIPKVFTMPNWAIVKIGNDMHAYSHSSLRKV